MLFSIITVTKDNLSGLKSTGNSVLEQTCSDYEWIVIDGNSGNETIGYLKQTKAKWVSEDDKGIYDAMNKGLSRVNGDYVIFMNAGDIFASPDVLEKISENIKDLSHTPSFIYGNAIEEDHLKKARPHTSLPGGMFTHHQAMLYRCEDAKTMQYEKTYTISADYDFTCRFLLKNKEALYIPIPICIFETGGISQKNVVTGRNQQYEIRKNLKLCSPIQNLTIKLLQTFAWKLRTLSPDLFWYIKKIVTN